MKHLITACAALVLFAAVPAIAGSIGTYSGCKRLSGGTKSACLSCVGGGNFYQPDSKTCGLPGAKKPTPKPAPTPTPTPTTTPTAPTTRPTTPKTTTTTPTTTPKAGGCSGCSSSSLAMPLAGLALLRRKRRTTVG